MIRYSIAELAADTNADALRLDRHGTPIDVLMVVDLSVPADDRAVREAATRLARGPATVKIGVTTAGAPIPTVLTELLDCTLTDGVSGSRQVISVADVDRAIAVIADAVRTAPRACVTLAALLGQTARLGCSSGLAAESAAYSMLLGGPEFQAWRAAHPLRPLPRNEAPPVLLCREDADLVVTINRPARHNAFDRTVRDGLIEAFDLALAEPSVERVELRGTGRSFCSGGDLDEFGTAPDGSTAHLIRLDRSVGARISECRAHVTSYLHGACIGAGIELPAFGDHIVAEGECTIRLPEIGMGLIPGAGGTVSLTHRVGRWRTAYLALTGAALDAATALDWGLIDRIGR